MSRFKDLGVEYDQYQKALPHYTEVQESIGKQVQLKMEKDRQQNIIEIGCGTGITTKEILKNMNEQSVLYAIDSEFSMIEEAKKNIQDSRVVWINKDANYCFNEIATAATMIISAYTIHNIPQEKRVNLYQQISKKLVNGGVFVNADKIAHWNDYQYKKDLEWKILQFAHLFILAGRPDLATYWIKHVFEDALPNRVLKEEQFTTDLIRNGFNMPKLVYQNNKNSPLGSTVTNAP